MERIYEMANRRKRQTGLPINIRIDENGWCKLGGHTKRIKVQMNYGEKMQNQPFCCMDLYGNIIEDTFDEKDVNFKLQLKQNKSTPSPFSYMFSIKANL